jgi:hypothetical protein
MMLGHGHIDITIGCHGIPVKGPFGQRPAVFDLHGHKFAVIHVFTQNPAVVHGIQGRLDSAVLIAAPLFIAGPVKHLDLCGPRLQGQDHQRGHHLRMGVGPLFHGPVPPDVGLDHHGIAFVYKPVHTAHGIHQLPDHHRNLFSLGHKNI